MKTFEAIFPILALYKDRKDYSIENIDVDDIFDSGTGFFVSETGIFMSVGHNFAKNHELERASKILFAKKNKAKNQFQTSDVADFYVLLVQNGQPELKPIADYQTIYLKEEISEDHKGRDLAVGKVNFVEGEKCECLKMKFETFNELSQLQIRGLKRVENYDHERLSGRIIALNIDFYIKITKLFEPSVTKSYNHITFFQHQEQESNVFTTFQVENHSNRDKLPPSNGFHGLSGSPVLENNLENDEDECVGIFFADGEKGTDETNTHGYFIPTTNPYLQRLFYRFQKKFWVKATQNLGNLIVKDQMYQVHWDSKEQEEFVIDEQGEPMTLLCFKYEF